MERRGFLGVVVGALVGAFLPKVAEEDSGLAGFVFQADIPPAFETEPWELEEGALDDVLWVQRGEYLSHPELIRLYGSARGGGTKTAAFDEALQAALKRTHERIGREYLALVGRS